ncbi:MULTISPECIES: EscU/YscU/HrcU family type III secretion system export apparatus switch protein [Microbacterium]|uniref:EscU/YscU/HrcU family type III secretion system export apparatus switch protein n=1 Tax=Microbacterium aurugineum TaxID=2851642 RepID=A0ABY4J3K0_9MICO|nr:MULTISPECIES: EscU/YscU/HrcU family type III secretion system export apparatus switch protein [Microbacterium]MCZ4299780.1 EscU/YscU/HrcU family type III secretion system export apparatus switch protein [Microbacterium oxydans]TCJ28246.1 EscU/YscU/HrcU family type III secretion system export apparatus switch protein [Microbacterium sp. PI-1]UPL18551.1 EscU/YscU/HrcU family type III secretion system export apparatus switch protein [Microbacterium aurugineum]
MSGTDSGERSEKATDKHLREARKKGRLSRSQDLTAWLGIGAAAVTMPAAIALGASAGTEQLLTLTSLVDAPTPEAALTALGRGLASVLPTLAVMLAAVAIVTLIGAVIQGGVHLKPLTGRFEQFNVVTGIRRVFGMQALWEGAKALLKTAAIGIALWFVIASLMPVLTASGAHSISRLLGTASEGTAALLQTAIAVGLVLAAIDMFVVMRRNRKHTRMTKREVRDENKNSEGDPLIRQQRRSRQLAISRNRMISAVAGSDVVLVNPTHIAVALRYEVGRAAPKVVAKGSGVVAERIREEATRTGVPMVREVSLARALHAACELGQEIPEDLYNAVARVLVFVDALRRRGAARGIHSLPYRRTV